jgi:hypothetical protein
MDLDPTFQRVGDLTLNIYSFSRTEMLRPFKAGLAIKNLPKKTHPIKPRKTHLKNPIKPTSKRVLLVFFN